jgi:hypothetical protein
MHGCRVAVHWLPAIVNARLPGSCSLASCARYQHQLMLAEGLVAIVLSVSGDTLTLTAPRSTVTAEPWFCIRYQVCLKI